MSGAIEQITIKLKHGKFLGSTLKELINANMATPEKKCALGSITNPQFACYV
jgi:hypothetical protein